VPIAVQEPEFARGDLERLSATLARFLAHIAVDSMALTGGVAIQIHSHSAGVSSGRTRIADLDFVATSVDAIRASVATHFLVSHFHLPHPGYPKFMVQVVDPDTRLRIDVFPDLVGSIGRATLSTVAGQRLLVLDAHSILDHKLHGLSRASAARPIDEKHRRDAITLASLCGRHVDPLQTDWVTIEIYDVDLRPCPRCEVSRTPGFNVAPRQQIFEVLGYN